MITTQKTGSNVWVADGSSVADLRPGTANGDENAIRAAAKQFEALFMDQVLKSMRATVSDNELMDNQDTKLFQGMFDQQLTSNLANGHGFGLADSLLRQMLPASLNVKAANPAVTLNSTIPSVSTPPVATPPALVSHAPLDKPADTPAAQFVRRLGAGLQRAADALGVHPLALAAQAALETGWGKREIVDAQGKNSFNVFGVKADAKWSGKVMEVGTTEFVDGKAVQTKARFRAYDSYADALKDYAKLLGQSPRYQPARNAGRNIEDFAHALQSSGYATDPSYANKITKIASNPALRAMFSTAVLS